MFTADYRPNPFVRSFFNPATWTGRLVHASPAMFKPLSILENCFQPASLGPSAAGAEDLDQNCERWVTMTALCLSFLELGDTGTQRQRNMLLQTLCTTFGTSRYFAEDLMSSAEQVIAARGGPQACVRYLARKLYKTSGREDFRPLMMIIKSVHNVEARPTTDAQIDALVDLQRGLHIGE